MTKFIFVNKYFILGEEKLNFVTKNFLSNFFGWGQNFETFGEKKFVTNYKIISKEYIFITNNFKYFFLKNLILNILKLFDEKYTLQQKHTLVALH